MRCIERKIEHFVHGVVLVVFTNYSANHNYIIIPIFINDEKISCLLLLLSSTLIFIHTLIKYNINVDDPWNPSYLYIRYNKHDVIKLKRSVAALRVHFHSRNNSHFIHLTPDLLLILLELFLWRLINNYFNFIFKSMKHLLVACIKIAFFCRNIWNSFWR